MKNTLLQEWVTELNPFSQSALISTLRGCDTEDKELKSITMMLRHLIVVNLKGSNKYSTQNIIKPNDINLIIQSSGSVIAPHWTEHIMQAFKIIASEHPNNYVRAHYLEVVKLLDSTIGKLPPHVMRLRKEAYELNDKITKLKLWLSDNEGVTSQYEQLALMERYLEIVKDRYQSTLLKTKDIDK